LKLFSDAKNSISAAVRKGAFPAAVAEVGNHNSIFWREAFGSLEAEPDSNSAPLNSVFDLASLTKVIATTSVAMTAVDQKLIALYDPIAKWLPEWKGEDRQNATLKDLLLHSSGLTTHMPFFRDCQGRIDFQHAICSMPLEYQPGRSSVYSDLGFILLGFILEDAFNEKLDSVFCKINNRCNWGELSFNPSTSWTERTAPTEIDPWRGRLLVGEVHDENAWALGGVAGHAGVFGTAEAVGSFARTILSGFLKEPSIVSSEVFLKFTTRVETKRSSRALGWDTMLPTSSCGNLMSKNSIGHTGFTGTSLWIDPVLDAYVVLLTNRVHPKRSNNAIMQIRPAFHNAVMAELRSV